MPGPISDSYRGPKDGRVPSWMDDLPQPTEWEARIVRQGWNPWSKAPKNGQWIIAVCNDGVTVHRVSWGLDRCNQLCWCEADRSRGFGDGLFAGWINCPQPSA